MVVQEIEDVSLCAFVKLHVYLFCSESGAFLVFSKKMLPKLKQENQSLEPHMHGRTGVVHQVSFTPHHLFIQLQSSLTHWTVLSSYSNGTHWKTLAEENTAGRRRPALSPLSVSLDQTSALDQCLKPFTASLTNTFRAEASRGKTGWTPTGPL